MALEIEAHRRKGATFARRRDHSQPWPQHQARDCLGPNTEAGHVARRGVSASSASRAHPQGRVTGLI
jgi:hypothetical protein